MKEEAAAERTYRFAPLDRTGLLLGLSGIQCALLAAGVLVAGAALRAHANPAALLVPLVLGIVLAFGSWSGRPLHQLLPLLGRSVIERTTGRSRWLAPIPGLTGTAHDDQLQPALPPWLGPIELLDAGPTGGPGVVWDRAMQSLSASIPVRGREFTLVERGEQERILSGWGEVIGAFCQERGQVSRVRVTEWAAPGGVAGDDALVAATGRPTSDEAVSSYAALLAEAGPMSVRHEVLMTVTVDPRRVRRGRGVDERRQETATTVLLDELRQLAARLEAVGLSAGPPLTVQQLAAVLRDRLDPTSRPTRPRTLGQAAGLISLRNAGPLAAATAWDRLTVDGSLHRAYWIAEWPRLDVPQAWLEPMLLHAGGVRTFALHYEPVRPSTSRRRIDRDATRLAADEQQRSRGGFRISAVHRRAQSAVLEREGELVAGFAELEYAGFVVVSAPTLEALDRSCAEYEQSAAQCGLELRALDGRHHLGLVCALPLGRGLAGRRSDR